MLDEFNPPIQNVPVILLVEARDDLFDLRSREVERLFQ